MRLRGLEGAAGADVHDVRDSSEGPGGAVGPRAAVVVDGGVERSARGRTLVPR